MWLLPYIDIRIFKILPKYLLWINPRKWPPTSSMRSCMTWYCKISQLSLFKNRSLFYPLTTQSLHGCYWKFISGLLPAASWIQKLRLCPLSALHPWDQTAFRMLPPLLCSPRHPQKCLQDNSFSLWHTFGKPLLSQFHLCLSSLCFFVLNEPLIHETLWLLSTAAVLTPSLLCLGFEHLALQWSYCQLTWITWITPLSPKSLLKKAEGGC